YPHQITGMKPAAGPRLFSRPCVVVIAGKKSAARRGAVSPHPEFPDGAGRHISLLIVNDPIGETLGRLAETALPYMSRLAIGADPRARSGLGHRPGFDQGHAESRFERGVVLGIDTGAEAEPEG